MTLNFLFSSMAKFLLILHLSTFFVILDFVPISSLSAEIDALLEIKRKLKDPMNNLETWNKNSSHCEFIGVTCDLDSGHVTGISLVNMSLSGELSPSISLLSNLNTFEIGSNDISGIVPLELAKCTNLQVLNLSSNTLTGQLPDLSVLQNLKVLDLSTNNFIGKFPSWVVKLSNLNQLGLAQNNFDAAEIPESIGTLRNLTWLFLAQCNLRGEIPASIFELTSLGTLDLSRNKISGSLPSAISNLQKLYKIELYQNNLTGEIPPEIANLTMLQEFDVSRNQLVGELPPGIGNLKQLTLFQVYQNGLWGKIPEGFGQMQLLQAFSIYENKFSGEFPANFGRFSPLNSIDISENSFTGAFPRFLCQNNKLQFLLALDNNFSGEFPDSYSKCKTLVRFRISQNYFTGKVPYGLWTLPLAVIIDVADNDFVGGISSDIAISASLTQLYVQNNKFSGRLPIELGQLSQLQKLFAFNNSFNGQLPPQIGDLKQLSALHLECNSLSGSIPSELGTCYNLVDLDLAQNYLSGSIPATLGSLLSLNSLDLSHNLITGSIPDSLQALKLGFMNLSENNLSGRIPPQLLFIAGAEAFSGNVRLCIAQSPGDQRYTGLNICNFSHSHEDLLRKRIYLVLTILFAMIILLSGLAFVSYQSFKFEERKKRGSGVGMEKDSEWKLQSFQPTELDPKEIYNLEEENLIGCGGTGKVYRVDLKKNRGTMAVKKIWKNAGSKVLAAEINILGSIRHRNILKLHACLTGSGTSFLVFEYMPNGSLYQALRREIKGGQPELDWNKRHKIALGAAKGVMYLHHDCSPPVIHRDIKSSNILLDEEYEAKLADFGIAKVAEDSDLSSTLSSFAGTHGYIAPELAYSPKATEKSDIYSFGVVLLELLTGRSPNDSQFAGKDIVKWVSVHLDAQNLALVLDSRVPSPAKEDMVKVLKVAMLCTSELPSERPTMREVVKMLIDADRRTSTRAKGCKKNC